MVGWGSDAASGRTSATSAVQSMLCRRWMLTVAANLEDVNSASWILRFAASSRVHLTLLGTWRLHIRASRASNYFVIPHYGHPFYIA